MAVITELKAIWIINLYDYCARAVSITVEFQKLELILRHRDIPGDKIVDDGSGR